MKEMLAEYYSGLISLLAKEPPDSARIFAYWQKWWHEGSREFKDTIFAPYKEVVLKEEPLHDLLLTHPLKNLEINLEFATLIGYKPEFIDKSNKKTQWAPMNLRSLRKILDFVNENFGFKDKVFYSLGCGDARECIIAENFGAKSIGVELNEKMYKVAKKLTSNYEIEILNEDFFEVDLSDADIVFLNAHKYNRKEIAKLFEPVDGAILIITENYFGEILKTFKTNMTDDQPEFLFNVNICKK